MRLEQLPGYAPDLNPDEGIWNYLKRVELGNVYCQNLEHLHQELIRARERLRHKREIIRNCMRECGYLEQSSPMRLPDGEEKGPNVLYDATIEFNRAKWHCCSQRKFEFSRR